MFLKECLKPQCPHHLKERLESQSPSHVRSFEEKVRHHPSSRKSCLKATVKSVNIQHLHVFWLDLEQAHRLAGSLQDHWHHVVHSQVVGKRVNFVRVGHEALVGCLGNYPRAIPLDKLVQVGPLHDLGEGVLTAVVECLVDGLASLEGKALVDVDVFGEEGGDGSQCGGMESHGEVELAIAKGLVLEIDDDVCVAVLLDKFDSQRAVK